MNKVRFSSSISYKQLGVILASLAVGIVVTKLVQNADSAVVSSFSTPELISYVLSLVLSAASIVLSMAAISLGKFSEDAILKRSDESIKLQTEVFLKTTEALQDIKASTGVTEKRIEDIIAGRAGELSQKIAEYASDEGARGKIDIDELRKKIEESISQGLGRENKQLDQDEINRQKESEKRQRKIREIRDRYSKLHDEFMVEIGNLDGIKIDKIGHGRPRMRYAPRDRLDSIFRRGDQQFSVTTLAPALDGGVTEIAEDNDTIIALLDAIDKLSLQHLYIVQFVEDDADISFDSEKSILESFGNLLNSDLAKKLSLSVVRYSDKAKWVEKLLK